MPPPTLEVATQRARRAIQGRYALNATLASILPPRQPSLHPASPPLQPQLSPRTLRARANFRIARRVLGLEHRVDPEQIQHRVVYRLEDVDPHNLVHGAARRAGHLEREALRIRSHLPPLLRDVYAVRYQASCGAARPQFSKDHVASHHDDESGRHCA